MKFWIRAIFACGLIALLFSAGCGAEAEGQLTLPQDLTVIKEEAFQGLTGVTQIDLPAGVTHIGAGAFRDCGDPAAELKYYFAPAGVTLGEGAFDGCRATVTLNGTELPRLSYTVSGSGVTVTGMSGQPTEAVIPDTIGGKPVIAIGSNAFKDKTALTRVTIPATVTSIGQNAFQSCYALTGIDLPEGLTRLDSGAFRNCRALTGIDLPSGVTSLPSEVFLGCYALAEIDLTGISSLGSGVFRDCRALTEITIPSGVTSLPTSAFEDAQGLRRVYLPDTLTAINSYAFYGCRALEQVAIPSGVTAIPNGCFQNCASLHSVQLPAGLTSIAQNAFRGCTALTGINFPEGLLSIGQEAFRDACVGQSENAVYALPASVETFGSNAFYNCGAGLLVAQGGNLEALAMANGYTLAYDTDDGFRFQYKKINNVDTLVLTGYKGPGGSVAIPAGPSVIGESAFENQPAITAVTIPDGVTLIDRGAFRQCTGLSRVVMPDSLTSIGVNAFASCAALTDVTFSANLTAIDSDAFDSACTVEGTHFYTLPDHIATLGGTPFTDCGAVLCFTRGSDTAALFRQNQYVYTYTGETDFRFRWYNNEGTQGHQERLVGYAGSAASVEIPAHVWLIDAEVFRDHAELTRAVIPEGVTHIYANAFRDCVNLTDITLPASLTEVRDNAFYGCGSAAASDFELLLPPDIAIVRPGAFSSGRMLLVCDVDSGTAGVISNRGYSFLRAEGQGDPDLRYKYTYFNHVWGWGLYDYVGPLSSVCLPDDCLNVDGSVLGQKVNNGLELVCGQLSDTAQGLSAAGINFTFPGHEGLRYRVIDGVLYLMGYAGSETQLVIPQAAEWIGAGRDEQVRQNSFQNLTALTRLVLPEGVTHLGDGAFSGCTNLTDITLPDSLRYLGQKVFRYAGQNLSSPFFLTLPDHLADLVGRGGGANSFEDLNAVLQCGKTSQTAALLADKNYVYTCPGEHDFRYRYETYPSGSAAGRQVWLVGYEGTDAQVAIPAGIYGIRWFSGNTTDSNWPTFHGYGLRGNETVTKAVIPEGTVVIEDSAFMGCVNLTDITFPNSLKVLKNHAFAECGKNAAARHYYALPDNMEEISTNTAAGWGAFTDINQGRISCAPDTSTARILSGIVDYNPNGSYRFALKGHETDGLMYHYDRFTENGETMPRLVLKAWEGSGAQVTIPSGCGLYRIENDVFRDRDNLEKVVIPEGVVEIGDRAFSGCAMLHEGVEPNVIVIPDGVVRAGSLAFQNLGTAYTSQRFCLVLPASLTEFDINIFDGCNAVLVAPAGSPAAAALYTNWYYYYTTLEDALSGDPEKLQYQRYYVNGLEQPHVHYGRQ